MPSVEIVRFPGSEAFLTDPLVLEDALEILKKADGVIDSPYYGLQTEDGSTGYLIVKWETYEHHMRLTQQPHYQNLISALERARSGPLDLQHVDNFDKDVAPSLEAPATEFALITPKDGASLEAFQETLENLGENLLKEKTCHHVAAGESREKEGTWVMVIGWDSVQAHVTAVAQGVFPELIKNLKNMATIEIKHANLVKYTK
ncbi:hypothetical protein LshimejAT787_0502510 [Lyophyllum shimeji]|uniref:ABM domain-containing protein n=1 Tax=Lyophyllum shimeji TaxID=47721 RepID=A0A9P3PN75_LYOSH|nr:hypothetical protein LshimejAT787_0502510 [Lyophyllum shimeji]